MRKSTILTLITGMLSLGGTVLFSSPTHAASPTITMTVGNPNNGSATTISSQSITPNLDGTTKSSHYWVPITINMTNANKYSVTVQSNSATLKDSSTNKTIAAVSSSGKSLTQLTNEWGYRYKTDVANTSDGFTDSDTALFKPLSTTATTIVNQATAADKKYIVLDFGAGVTQATAAGNYSAAVTVGVVATPQTVVTIVYGANGGTGSPANSTVTLTPNGSGGYTASATLSATMPTRAGYGFVGWTTERKDPVFSNNTVSFVDGLAAGTFYAPSSTLSINNAPDGDIVLYALWEDTGLGQLWDAGTMQNLSATACVNAKTSVTASAYNKQSSTSVSKEAHLKDSRDGKSYLVNKLADNNCWMVQNLALDIGKTLTSANSDVSTKFTMPTSSTDRFDSTKSGDPETYLVNQMHTGSHIDNTYDSASNNGSYYSWFTATAGTGNSSISDNQEAPSSICPKNWKLPSGGPYGQQEALYTNSSYNSYERLNAVWHCGFVGGFGLPANNDYWWSRTAANSTEVYYMLTGGLWFVNVWKQPRYVGMPVRCVLGS